MVCHGEHERMKEEEMLEIVILWMSEREKNNFNIFPAKFTDIKGLSEKEVLHIIEDGVRKGYIWDISSEDLGKLWVLSPKGITFAKTLKKK
jgi:hypothetical protein